MQVASIVGILLLLLMASCAVVMPPAPIAPPQAAATPRAAEVVVPPSAPIASQSPSVPTVSTQVDAAPVAPAPSAAAPLTTPSTTRQSAAKAAEPSAKAPAKVPAPAAQATKKEAVASDVTKQNAPPLNLTSLEQRLKDTNAIGVLTKITLKNQVDDLLDHFRAFYQGKLRTTLVELRRSYDLLVMKVLSLLQDSDPALAAAIVASRDAIWGILSDPAKFATI
jgi:hypothetical protein